MTSTRRIVIPGLGLAVAGAAFGAMMLASSPTSAALPAVAISGSTPAPSMAADMSGMDMSGSTPTPTATHTDDGQMPAEMPGMDMSGSTPTPTPTHTDDGQMPGNMPGMDMPESGHSHGGSPAVNSNRPLAPVLGTFGGGASAVMLGAGLLRRKDRAADAAKQAARAARKAGK